MSIFFNFNVQFGTGGDDGLEGTAGADWMFGFSGNDRLIGGDGDDRLFGGPGDDFLFGGNGNDRLFGGRGDDVLAAGAGRDTLFGGQGLDTASFDGGVGDFTVTQQGGKVTVTNLFDSTDVNSLFSIERLYFAEDDYTVDLTGGNNAALARDDTGAATAGQLLELAALTANDFDWDGDDLTIVSLDTSGLKGSAVLNLDGTVTFDPGSAFDSLAEGQTEETAFTYTISDGKGSTDTATVTITVTGVNDAPELTAAATAEVEENTTAVLTAAATDPDAGDSVTFSLTGADAALFTISATGELSFVEAPDFEAPQAAGGGNTYDVTIVATDTGGLTDSQDVAVTVTDVVETPPADIVITEVMQNPSAVSDSAGEWFELYNAGADPVDLEGYVFSDNGSDSFTVVGSLVIQPGAYLVLGNNGDPTTNGGVPVDYEYSGMFLGNSDDELVITDTEGREIDRIEWDGGPAWPDPTGASMALIDLGLDNGVGANWQTADQAYGDGDFGTPGLANDTLALASLVINEVMQNPAAVSDSAGEWFEVFNAGAEAVDLEGYTFSDDGADSFTIVGSLMIQPGDYLVLGNNADPATNGGVAVDYEYAGMFLANSDDELIITDTIGREVDRIEWDGGPAWPDPTGASMSLINPSLDNNVGANWEVATQSFGDGDLGTPGAENAAPPALASLVITEVLQNPSVVGDSAGEWFEILNTGAEAVDLEGYTFSDNGSDSFTVVGSLLIQPGAYLVLGNNADSATNGGATVDYEYSGMFLANSDDEVVITDTFGREVDRIEWDGGPAWPDPTGASMSLLDPGLDNNVGANWTTADQPFGDGDLGTPGAENFAPVAPEIVITEVLQNPSAVSDGSGEWFEVFNAGATAVDLDGWTVSDNGSDSFVITGSLVIAPGAYLVLGLNADTATNGGAPVDYEYTGMFLSNSDDEIILTDTEGTEIDRIEWDGGPAWPDPTGASMALIDPGLDNNDGANWVTSDQPFGDGDLGTPGAENLPPAPTLISTIQGSGFESALVGEDVLVSAVVTATLGNGYFLQEEDADADGDSATSEGLFVFTGDGPTVQAGDVVEVTGTVGEFFGLTQLTQSALSIIGTATLPTAVGLSLPFSMDATLEAIEGMRVSLAPEAGDAPLTIIENFNFDRFGEIVIAEGVQIQPTQIFDAQTQATEIADLAAQNQANRITIDDGVSGQNPTEFAYVPNTSAGDNGNGFLDAGDSFDGAGPTLRLGAELTAPVEGVMTFSFGEYKIIPTEVLAIDSATNEGAREPDAPVVGGSLQVVSFNALNYFTTLSGTTPTGAGVRGATTPGDLARQTDKLVNALVELDGDIIGLQEIENNGFGPGSAIATLTDALNARLGATVYDYVDASAATATGFVGTDAITTGILYKVDEVAQIGDAAILEFTDGDQQRNRPAVAASFEELDADGGRITVAVNHFKSKGPGGATGDDADQGDGQGAWNATRTDAANELTDWLNTDPTGAGTRDVLIIGDLNAYNEEDPVQAIEAAGYTNLLETFVGAADSFSFVFDGQQGALDHALANSTLSQQVVGVAEWHINAQEPDLLGYSSEFNDLAFYNGDDVFASSDHDPLIVGINLTDGIVLA